jgi:hypothetical protein
MGRPRKIVEDQVTEIVAPVIKSKEISREEFKGVLLKHSGVESLITEYVEYVGLKELGWEEA